MAKSKIRLTLTDGRELDFEGLFAPLADRVELERRFSVSIQDSAREEHIAFLIFRSAARCLPEFASTSFEEFLEQVDVYEIVAEQDGPPTVSEVPTG